MKLPITVVSITYNESFHIENYLSNVTKYFEKIVIIDSGSDDGTLDIIDKFQNVEVKFNKFKNFGTQWNFAINYIQKYGGWSLKMDPDERMTDELFLEINKFFKDGKFKNYTNCCFKRRLWYLSKPLNIKSWVTRLWETNKCSFTKSLVNEHPIVKGKKYKFKNYIEHLDSKNHHEWINKQNLYSSLEAISLFKYKKRKLEGSANIKLISFIKKFFIFIPLYRQIYFIYCYFVKKSFLSGYLGYIWSIERVNLLTDIKNKYIEINNNKNHEAFIKKLLADIKIK
tara:strand:+ start:4359 stop:5210 length:852 start_codon:yes stop_codon:yes gene_type:complete